MAQSEKSDPAFGYMRLALVKPFVDYVGRLGISARGALEEFALEANALNDPGKFVHADVVYRLLNALSDAAADPHLGFHVGERQSLAGWPPFHRAATEARTFGEFLQIFISDVPNLSNSIRYSLTITGQNAVFAVERLTNSKASPKHAEGSGAAQFARFFYAAAGKNWDPEQVTIRTRFPDAMPFRPYGMRLERKRSGAFEVHFPAAWLFEPFNLDLRELADDQQLSQMRSEASAVIAFRSAALPLLSRLDLKAEHIAPVVGLAAPMLEKALKSAGTTPARELRRLRVEVAKAALLRGESVSAISQSFGYSDPSHFARFFRTQTGKSPREYRRSS
ncbi:helix-turn-helix domain-containing protein [Primorskyibacter sp. S87]|uniref:AraC family transcriptional regulator n=1 Tax=Primorskyibacter sp. S87 TaxID=3415126 RepID=UPI003C7E1E8C